MRLVLTVHRPPCTPNFVQVLWGRHDNTLSKHNLLSLLAEYSRCFLTII